MLARAELPRIVRPSRYQTPAFTLVFPPHLLIRRAQIRDHLCPRLKHLRQVPGHVGDHFGLGQVLEKLGVVATVHPAQQVVQVLHLKRPAHRLVGIAIAAHAGVQLGTHLVACGAVVEKASPVNSSIRLNPVLDALRLRQTRDRDQAFLVTHGTPFVAVAVGAA